MATCQCENGHTWVARVLEDDASTNCMTLADEDNECPECHSQTFEIIEVDYSDPFMD